MELHNPDYIFKLIIIGDSSIGKTCLAKKYIENKYTPSYSLTIGVEFFTKTVIVNDDKIKLQIWDTAGQERFKSVTRPYYRGCVGIILCFSLINRESFRNLKEYLVAINNYCENFVIILVGNKSDMINEDNKNCAEKIYDYEIENFVEKYNLQNNPIVPMKYFQVSVASGENVNQVFDFIVENIYKKMQDGIIPVRKETQFYPNPKPKIKSNDNNSNNQIKGSKCC